MPRTILLRFFGLLVVAAFGVAATTLLATGLQLDVGGLTAQLETIANTLTDPLDEGRAVLLGALLALFAALAGFVMMKRSGHPTVSLAKSEQGDATLDMVGVARVTERHLRARVHPQIKVSAKRRSLIVAAPTLSGPTTLEIANEAAVLVPGILADAGAEGVPYRVVTGRPDSGRVR